jgi:alginate O-acetyltransferase complex protein AlgI
MIFTSIEFLLFFGLVVLARSFIRSANADKWLLLIASILFYLSWSLTSIVFIGFTALLDYSLARRIDRMDDPKRRRRLLGVSLTASLGLLVFFKYGNFALDNLSGLLRLAGLSIGPLNYSIVLPPAISFYTFASVGYMVDVYYRRIPACTSAREYMLFLTFFPKLLSGPITRGGAMLPQFKEPRRATAEDVEIGLSYILIGAVQKLVIADQIAASVNRTFLAPQQFDAPTLLLGVVGYAVQIFCDFAGYSAMAIGFARLLGFAIPENFQFPYSSTSVTELWRRWHMSLSTWFRDYVFLPLELATRGNPRPNLRVCTNLFATMILLGLWHGASWNFVVFGAIQGFAMAAHKMWTVWNPLKRLSAKAPAGMIWTACAHVLTLAVFLLGLIFFGTPDLSAAFVYLQRLAFWQTAGEQLNSPFIAAAIAIVFLVHLVVHKDRNLALELPTRAFPIRVMGYTSLVLLLALFAATEPKVFIYFQF